MTSVQPEAQPTALGWGLAHKMQSMAWQAKAQYSTSLVIRTAISVIRTGESAQKSLVLVFIATHIRSLGM